MKKREIPGVEGLAIQDLKRGAGPFSIGGPDSGQPPPASTIVRIAENRVTQMLPVGADLVGPAGFEPEIHGCPGICRP